MFKIILDYNLKVRAISYDKRKGGGQVSQGNNFPWGEKKI